jgi:hypothetical protein
MDTQLNTNTFDTLIVVGSSGHVWVARSAIYDGTWLHMNSARIIRVWGTTQGLNQLVSGPTKDTILDAQADVVSLFHAAIIAVIPANDGQWKEYLA